MGASPANVIRGFWSRTLVRDALFALVAAVVAVIMVADTQFAHGVRGTATAMTIWSGLLWVPVAWRRVAPVAATIAVAVIAVLHMIFGYPLLMPGDLAVLVVLYSIAAYGPKWASRAALGLAFIGSLVMSLNLVHFSRGNILESGDIYDFIIIALPAVALSAAAWAFGSMRRARRETIVALQSRADAMEQRAQQLEFERDQQRIIATQTERARIAREMHDIVAHSLSIIIVQADGGRYAAIHDGAAAAQALNTISETGRSALKEMRRLLGILRSEDGATRTPELTPMPGSIQGSSSSHLIEIADGFLPDAATGVVETVSGHQPVQFPPGIAELFDQARTAGMPLKVITSGEPHSLEPGAALTLQRVCQEALTNVRKHAGSAAQTTVKLDWQVNQVILVVSDDGDGGGIVPANSFNSTGQLDYGGSGYGLIGLQERAALVGGTVTYGPTPSGGWEIKFIMPL